MLIKFKGGLGNQMFQYIFMKHLQVNYGVKDIKADLTGYRSGFGHIQERITLLDTTMDIATRQEVRDAQWLPHDQKVHTYAYWIPLWIEKTFNKRYFLEPNRQYINPATLLDYSVLDGYWQSWRYLENVEEIVRKDFNILYRCSEQTQQQARKIALQNAVMVGVRKGDVAQRSNHYSTISPDYYERAFRYISQRVDNPVFYIFANDIQWAKENLPIDGYNVSFRESGEQVSDVEELQLMHQCKHAIVPNSTFHWMGAFLIDNPDKIVIRPEHFFCDGSPEGLYPDNWVIV